MTRYKLTLEYDGGGFVGWQRQDNGPSVQQALEDAVKAFCGETVTSFAAGRTDAGVHALGQVAHVDLAKETTADTVRDALNFHLKPAPIAVLRAEAVGEDFHARFSAKARLYRYRIVNRRPPLALDRGHAWLVGGRARCGGHARRGAGAGRPPRLHQLPRQPLPGEVAGEDAGRAGGAPRAARRSRIERAGALLPAPPGPQHGGHAEAGGRGQVDRADVAAALAARDRSAAGPTAPPEGLYLTEVWY